MGYFTRACVLLLGLSSFQIFAQDMKMGMVDLQKIMQSSTQVQEIRHKLETDFRARRDKLIAMEKELKENVDKLKRDSAVLNQAQKKDLEKKIMGAQQTFEREGQQYQQELNTSHNEAMEGFFNQVKAAIQALAESEKFAVIFQKDVAPYSAPNLDITEAVIKKIGEKK